MFDQTQIKLWIQAAEHARYACARQTYLIDLFDATVQTNKTSPIKHDNKRNVLSCLIECLMVFKFYQSRPNTIKQHQSRWSNGKMFGHQTIFDGVWSPNISRLDSPLFLCFLHSSSFNWCLEM